MKLHNYITRFSIAPIRNIIECSLADPDTDGLRLLKHEIDWQLTNNLDQVLQKANQYYNKNNPKPYGDQEIEYAQRECLLEAIYTILADNPIENKTLQWQMINGLVFLSAFIGVQQEFYGFYTKNGTNNTRHRDRVSATYRTSYSDAAATYADSSANRIIENAIKNAYTAFSRANTCKKKSRIEAMQNKSIKSYKARENRSLNQLHEAIQSFLRGNPEFQAILATKPLEDPTTYDTLHTAFSTALSNAITPRIKVQKNMTLEVMPIDNKKRAVGEFTQQLQNAAARNHNTHMQRK